MKKIPTLFEREFENGKLVGITPSVLPEFEWVFEGEGVATTKFDGACCAVIDGEFYKRYDAKNGKTPPTGAIPCCEPDPITGHWPHWVKVDWNGGYAKSGYEKTKNGVRYRDYYKEASANLLKQAPNLKGITLRACDYRNAHPKGFVVYSDPPYAGTKQYANAQMFDYDEFWSIMRKWSKSNIVIVSEQSAPRDWTSIWEHKVNRSIKATDKRMVTEKLFIKE